MPAMAAVLSPCQRALFISIEVLLFVSPCVMSERIFSLKVKASSTVVTSSGPVVGQVNDGIQSFKGIPYAKPPVGSLRFMAPEPPLPWTTPHDSSEFGVACMQTPLLSEISESDQRAASEDCLTLNVWTPDAAAGSRPVLVFVHGGGFSWGTPLDPLYHGHNLAKRGDIVVVTIQYRLGPWGWLDLSSFGGTNSSGNNGLLDMLAALQWLQLNAAAFGGDPGNVTLSGQSAGAISAACLLTNSAAGDTFHRAILQSGAPANVRDKAFAKEITEKYMSYAGASSFSELQALTREELYAAQLKFVNAEFVIDIAFMPVVDGEVVEQFPTVSLRDGASTVPVLIGTTRDEIRYYMLAFWFLAYLPKRVAYPWLNDISGGRAVQILDAYLEARPDLSGVQQVMAAITATSFGMPAIRLAEALSGSPVWMYVFTLESNQYDGILGSPHSMDLPFTSGNLNEFPDLLDATENPAEYQQVANTVQDAWIAFVRDGSPSTDSLVWPAYNTDSRSTMLLDLTSSLVSDPFSVERTIWGDMPFDGVAPPVLFQTPLTHPGSWALGFRWAAITLVCMVALCAACAFCRYRRKMGASEEVELAS